MRAQLHARYVVCSTCTLSRLLATPLTASAGSFSILRVLYRPSSLLRARLTVSFASLRLLSLVSFRRPCIWSLSFRVVCLYVYLSRSILLHMYVQCIACLRSILQHFCTRANTLYRLCKYTERSLYFLNYPLRNTTKNFKNYNERKIQFNFFR